MSVWRPIGLTVFALLCGAAFLGVLRFFVPVAVEVSVRPVEASTTSVLTVYILPGVVTDASGQVDFYTLASRPVRVLPQAPLAGAFTRVGVEFYPTRPIPAGGTIAILFPQGTTFDSSCTQVVPVVANQDLNGLASGVVTIGSISCDESQRKIVVQTSGANLATDERVHVVLGGIINPTEPKDDTTDGYSATLLTHDLSGAFLDQWASEPYFIASAGTANISGLAFAQGTGGVSGLKVCLTGPAGFSCTTTNSTGAYAFPSVRAGTYTVSLLPPTEGLFIVRQTVRSVSVASGEVKSGVDFLLEPVSRSLTVSVSNIPEKTALEVFALRADTVAGTGYVTRTLIWNGSSSRTVALPVGQGVWDVGVRPVAATADFLLPANRRVTVSSLEDASVSIAIQVASQRLTGRVTDTDGNAVLGAFVTVQPSAIGIQPQKAMVLESAAGGVFSAGLRPGVYSVSATKPGFEPSVVLQATVFADSGNSAVDHNAAADVYVNQTLVTDGLVLLMKKGARSVSGRVLGADGVGIATAFVTAQRIGANGAPVGAVVGTPVSSAGGYTVFVRGGTWRMEAFSPDMGRIAATTVSVSGANLNQINLQVNANVFGTVIGSVTKGGQAVSGAFVTLTGSAGFIQTVTDDSGEFSLKARSGSDYRLEAFVPGAGVSSALTGLTVIGGGTLGGQQLVFPVPGTIRLTISGVTDAFVEANDGSGGRIYGTGVNATPGEYDLSVPAGTYTLTARSPTLGLIGRETGVIVTQGETTVVAMTPASSTSVSGFVTSATSSCVSGATVTLFDTKRARVISAVTDALGAYSLEAPQGSYNIGAYKSGCVNPAKMASLVVGSTSLTVGTNVALSAADMVLSGRVLFDGSPVNFPTKVVAKRSGGRFAYADVDTNVTSGDMFSLSLTDGVWTVFARADGYASSEQRITVVSGVASVTLTLAAIAGYTPLQTQVAMMTPAQGGIVKNEDIGTGFELEVPAGALGSQTDAGTIKTKTTTAIVSETPVAIVVGGKAIEITPETSTGQRITSLTSSTGLAVRVPYDEADVALLGVDEDDLVLATWSETSQQWEPLPTTVDTVANILSATITHFSLFAPVALSSNALSSSDSDSEQGSSSSGIVSAKPVVQPESVTIVDRMPSMPVSSTPAASEREAPAATEETPFGEMAPEPGTVRWKPPVAPTPVRARPSQPPVGDLMAPAIPSRPDAISPEEVAMTLEARIQNPGNVVAQREMLRLEGIIRTQGIVETFTLPLIFQMTDASRRVIYQEIETIAVQEMAAFEKQWRIATAMAVGTYRVFVKVPFEGSFLEWSDTFVVTEKTREPIFVALQWPVWFGFLASFALLLSGWGILRRFAKRKRR